MTTSGPGGQLPKTTVKKVSSVLEYPQFYSYHAISERLRKSTSSDLQCQVFCGGKGCKYCGGYVWPDAQAAIKGLFSHWVTDDILAMSRPNTKLISRYDIIGQFKDSGIRAVFNLQTPGEHASCGPPLESEGFSYKPLQLMENQVFFYNFAWKDYGTLPKWTILDIVKVMAFSLKQGKIAVHCHAGLGRTGVLIACYLIYWLRCRANDAIRYVRLKRPGSIQTSDQILCVQEFAQYVLPLFVVFPKQIDKKKKPYTLWQCLEDQNKVLHGLEQRHLRYIPRLIYYCCERLLQLATPLQSHSISASSDDSENIELAELTAFYNDFISNTYDATVWRPATTPSSSTPAPSSAASQQQLNEDELMVAGLKGLLESVGLYSNLDSSDGEDDDDSDVGEGDGGDFSIDASEERQSQLEKNVIYQQLMSSKAANGNLSNDDNGLEDSSSDEMRLYENQHTRKTSEQNGPHSQATRSRISATVVAKCMLFQHKDLQPSFWVFIQKYKKALNEDAGAWERLRNEPNPCVVAALLWNFLESSLSDPVLTARELAQIVLKPGQPTSVLPVLPKGARMTIEYLVRSINKFDIESDLRICLIQRLCSALTHQKMACKGSLMPKNVKWPKMREGTAKELVNFINNLSEIVQTGRWESLSSPDSSDHSSLNNNSAPSVKPHRISAKAVNIVALAIAR